MESFNKFWSEEKRQIAERCEDKNTRLFWDNLQGIYFIVQKYSDGSAFHSKETQLFSSPKISEINTFIKSYKP